MRVIAGTARSMPLHIPEGKEVRPTIDRYKETVFNIVSAYVSGGRTLDIFSGSGSIGIEALSRGAAEAVFVEGSRNAMACIEYNLNFTKLFEKAKLLKYDYSKALEVLGDRDEKFDFIFLDPPYEHDFEQDVIELIDQHKLLIDDGIIVCESSLKTDLDFIDEDNVFEIIKTKRFKSCQFNFLKYKS